MKRYWFQNKGYLFLAVLFGIVDVYFIYRVTMMIDVIVDLVLNQRGGDFVQAFLLSLFYMLISMAANAISYSAGQSFAASISNEMRIEYLKTLFSRPSDRFFNQEKSVFINDLDQNIDQIRIDYLLNIPDALSGIAKTVFYLYVIYHIHPVLMGITLVLLVLPSALGKFFSSKISQLQVKRVEANRVFTRKLLEILQAYLVLKESGTSGRYVADFEQSSQTLLRAKKRINNWRNLMFNSMFSINCISVVVIVFAGSLLVLNGSLTMGKMVSSIALISVSTNAIAEAFKYGLQVHSSRVLCDRVLEGIEGEQNVQEAQDEPKPVLPLTAQSLAYRYGERKIFADMQFVVEPGKSYAIIGDSGSGKSTLAKILMGIYRGYEGSLAFQNADFRSISEAGLHQLFYYIPQNPCVFTDTLLRNITLGEEEVDTARYEEILRFTGLDRLNQAKPNEVLNADTLSGGEQKKIEIARAMYLNRPVLLFDEPTSNLDPQGREAIEALIFALKAQTKLVITHNQEEAYLQQFDSIINLEEYRVPVQSQQS